LYASFDSYVLKAADRRDRLIYVLSQINAARGEGTAEAEESSSEEEEAEAEVRPCLSSAQKHAKLTFILQEFYTEGIVDLLEARRSIAEYSLPRLDFRYTALLA
jgi:U4/U6 small nuclear ribonucleoprotein PRP4